MAVEEVDMRMTRFWITLKQGVAFVLDRLEGMAGGELFIPKIPSMRISDLAQSLGPHCKLVEIGIRPGEKLHEILIPKEESRYTREHPRYYTTRPAYPWWEPEAAELVASPSHDGESPTGDGELGQPVEEDFEYASHSNSDWLDAGALARMLEE